MSTKTKKAISEAKETSLDDLELDRSNGKIRGVLSATPGSDLVSANDKKPKKKKKKNKKKKKKESDRAARMVLPPAETSTPPQSSPVMSKPQVDPIERGTRASLRRPLRIVSHALIGIGILVLAWAFVIWKWNDPVTAIYTWYEQGKLAHAYDSNAATIDAKIEAQIHATRPPVSAPRKKPAPHTPVPHKPAPHTPAPNKPKPSRSALQAEVNLIAEEGRLYRTESTEGEGIGRIMVPRLGLKMILLNGTDEGSLEKGPGRDLETYMPGQGQLIYVAGHRTTFLAPFANIQEIRRGDSITLAVPYGTFVYRVYSHVIVPAGDIARLRSHGQEIVTLQACHPRFFATNRYLVYGRLVEVVPTHGTPYGVDHGKPYLLGQAKLSQPSK